MIEIQSIVMEKSSTFGPRDSATLARLMDEHVGAQPLQNKAEQKVAMGALHKDCKLHLQYCC